MASITVVFTREQLTTLEELCWKLTCTATGSGMPSEIFIMHRRAEGSTEGNFVDQFETIADAQDLDRIPANAPDLEDEMPYYRAASVSLLFKSALQLEQIREEMKTIIQQTVDEVNAAGAVADEETVTFT